MDDIDKDIEAIGKPDGDYPAGIQDEKEKKFGFQDPVFQIDKKKAQVDGDVPMIPKKGRILVLQNDFVQRGRIIIPDNAQAKPTTGRVVAIGPEVEDDFVQLGETVVFSQYGGVPIAVITGENEVTVFLSLSADEIAGELIINPERLKK